MPKCFIVLSDKRDHKFYISIRPAPSKGDPNKFIITGIYKDPGTSKCHSYSGAEVYEIDFSTSPIVPKKMFTVV